MAFFYQAKEESHGNNTTLAFFYEHLFFYIGQI